MDSVIGNQLTAQIETPVDNSDLDDQELLSASAKMVIETCMDIRRGENVLIVCDPTTGEITSTSRSGHCKIRTSSANCQAKSATSWRRTQLLSQI